VFPWLIAWQHPRHCGRISARACYRHSCRAALRNAGLYRLASLWHRGRSNRRRSQLFTARRHHERSWRHGAAPVVAPFALGSAAMTSSSQGLSLSCLRCLRLHFKPGKALLASISHPPLPTVRSVALSHRWRRAVRALASGMAMPWHIASSFRDYVRWRQPAQHPMRSWPFPTGGALPNCSYCIFLLRRKATFRNYTRTAAFSTG